MKYSVITEKSMEFVITVFEISTRSPTTKKTRNKKDIKKNIGI